PDGAAVVRLVREPGRGVGCAARVRLPVGGAGRRVDRKLRGPEGRADVERAVVDDACGFDPGAVAVRLRPYHLARFERQGVQPGAAAPDVHDALVDGGRGADYAARVVLPDFFSAVFVER